MSDAPLPVEAASRPAAPRARPGLEALVLLAALALGAWLRFTGLNWDENQHLHPDERFLTMVETSIRLPGSLGEYFRTETSPLNPHNAGYGFFVYGTLPIFLVRAVAEWTGQTGYDQVTLLGRALSAGFDLISLALVYLLGARLYSRRVGALAALLSAFAVLQIQHAHFFIVDTFANTFILAALYFAVCVRDRGRWSDYALVGAALGMATASKIVGGAVAGAAVLAVILRVAAAPREQREVEAGRGLAGLVLAALVALLAFRVFQPYAFAGPGFFGLRPNPRWVANMAEILHQASGNVDFPPALQWADRTPVLFAWTNMVLWGMGLPLGLAAWAGWAWAALRLLRAEVHSHLIPVVWTGAFFLWQSSGFTPSMRYQLPVYPTLIVLAAWALWALWERAGRAHRRLAARLSAGALAGAVVLGAGLWGVAFTSIYTRPVTRVEASRWIYSHVPGVVNLALEGGTIEPVPVSMRFTLHAGRPHTASFVSQHQGAARLLRFTGLVDLVPESGPARLTIRLQESRDPATTIAQATAEGPFGGALDMPFDAVFESAPPLWSGHTYYLAVELEQGAALALIEPLEIVVDTPEGTQQQPIDLPDRSLALAAGETQVLYFNSGQSGQARAVLLPYATDLAVLPGPRGLRVELYEEAAGAGAPPLARGSLVEVLPQGETRIEIPLDRPVELRAEARYILHLSLVSGGALDLRGTVIVSESSWDDGLPLGLDGRSAGGRYSSANQELYWADDADENRDGVSDKLERIVRTLEQGDLLAITSNRQYGTIPRVPIRYPLTTAYYRALFGCPESEPVLRCGARITPETHAGELGYDLVAVFESSPTLGGIALSDQAAEEAFTVYDHPRVLLFARSESFSAEAVRAQLGAVDLSNVVHVLPGEAGGRPADLMLPADRLAEQRAGGTWSELFNRAGLLNRSDLAAVVAWWLLIAVLGWAAFPITQRALPGLADAGYPLARLVGLAVVAWGAWLLGSLRVPFGRATLVGVLLAMAGCSLALVWRERAAFLAELRRRRREIAWVEALALAFFLLALAIRLGNPDLWHPSKGGEKPMDLSYLQAVLRSTSFPPYDPWFAGGYINYYYYGFVLAAVPIRLLGILPTTAYNLAIPTFFALLALAGYSVGHNLVARWGAGLRTWPWRPPPARLAGTAAAVALVLLGNLGTARMLYEGLKRVGAGPDQAPAGFVVGWLQAARGTLRFLSLESQMPYALDSWYWDPSRAIPPGEGEAGPITEFPFFTFLYGDLHAHMISRPLAVAGLAWMLSWLLAAEAGRPRRAGPIVLSLALGGLLLGALRPTNLGDYLSYWGLGAAAAAAGAFARTRRLNLATIAEGALYAAALLAMAQLLYLPYHVWYGQGYGSVQAWNGGRTPLDAYLTIHGLFLFVLASWMACESVAWLAGTPISSLARLRPYAGALLAAALGALAVVVALAVLGYAIAPLVLPLMIWAGVLVLRPGLPIEKRLVLVLTGTGLALTFMVEAVVARGDISRMNTVFKFYLQVWELFAVSAAAALLWTIEAARRWRPAPRRLWGAGLALLVAGAAMYPLVASMAKIRDRWSSEAPRRLDGTAFMPYVTYHDLGQVVPLDEDLAAIHWLQDTVAGSPVIVEAHLPEYRWGARMTIYTGLPGVLGWNWHQRQQRVLAGDRLVWDRAFAITDFYLTPSDESARAFLERYDVSYVIVGSMERLFYGDWYPCLPESGGAAVRCNNSGRPLIEDCGEWCPLQVPPEACTPLDANAPELGLRCPTGGLDKFERLAEGGVLREAFRQGRTVIYEVVR